jgi:xylulose-5-phosphate/fructose-6-phosphate phosphoketolase
VANAYLDGTYSELCPKVSRDLPGLNHLVRQFSTPGGIPSHAGPHVPGSVHEGGELGYALAHAGGAAFDNPELLVACVIGDGEAETGPLAASWRLPAFLDPRRDGVVLPILHVNGYKISGPTVLGRSDDADIARWLAAQGWDPVVVRGQDPETVFAGLHEAVHAAHERARAIQLAARDGQDVHGAAWRAIVLRTPKGWTGPRFVDGHPVEGTHRSHQVPLTRPRSDPRQLAELEAWLRSYHPEELFDVTGRPAEEIAALAPDGELRMSATPHGNGGRLLRRLPLPTLTSYAVDVTRPGNRVHENTRPLGEWLRDLYRADARPDGGGTFRLFCPDETASNRLDAVLEATDRCLQGPGHPEEDGVSPHGRLMEVLSEHLCEGWLEGYLLTGRHGLFATYEAFAMVSASMLIQHVKWLQQARELPWRAPVASLNVLLTSTCWRNDHNGFSHQGPGLIDSVLPLAPDVVRVWFPPDANTTLAVTRHCVDSRDRVNLIVVDKQPHLQYLDLEAAVAHCAAGMSVWARAGTETADGGTAPDIVLAAAGDVPTLEALAAASLLREFVPALRVRVVNIVDLMALTPAGEHPHGWTDQRFEDLFPLGTDVVMAFHGHPRGVHQLLHGRRDPGRFHVRGYTEHGTTTTPFDMVVRNRMSRYHLALDVLDRALRTPPQGGDLARYCHEMVARHERWIVDHLEDMPEVHDWTWRD